MGRKRGRGRGRGRGGFTRKTNKDTADDAENEGLADNGVAEEEEIETEKTVEIEKENEENEEELISVDNKENNTNESKDIKGENKKLQSQLLNENDSSNINITNKIQEKQNIKSSNKVENKPHLEARIQNENRSKDLKIVVKSMHNDSSENEDLTEGQLTLDLGEEEDDVMIEDDEDDEDDDEEENELDVRMVSDEETETNWTQEENVTTPSTESAPTSNDPSEMVKNQLNQIQQQVMSHIMQYQANIMQQFQQLQSQMLAQATGTATAEMSATAPALDLSNKPPNLMNLANPIASNSINLTVGNSMLNTTKSGTSNSTSAAATPVAATGRTIATAMASNQQANIQIRGGSRNAAKKSFNFNELDEIESTRYRSLSPDIDGASSHDLTAAVNVLLNRKRQAPKHLNVFDMDEMDGPTMNPPCFKRKRTAFNEKQYNVLETTFEHNNFPEPIDQHCIALRIKTPYRSIKMWFQNRRASVRKKLDPSERGAPGEDGVMKSASDPDARWYCNLCPSTFIAKKFLDRHRELHRTNTSSCGNCHMKFTHKLLLDTHRISKCSSKAGVDLSHINDDEDDMDYSKRVIEDYNRRMQSSLIGTDAGEDEDSPVDKLPLLMTLQQLGKQQQQQQSAQTSNRVNQLLVNPRQEEDADDPDDHQVLQQLLLAQVKQAKEKRKQEELRKKIEQQKRFNLQKVSSPSHNVGMTIIPMQVDDHDDIKIKEECPEPDYVIEDNQQPSTLQDQITSILEAEKRASADEAAEGLDHKITIKHELDDLDPISRVDGTPVITQKKRQSMQDQIHAILKQQEILMNNRQKVTDEEEPDEAELSRRRRRTTVFSESQLRILYLHYNYNNFPDPSMFKIIGYLAKLDAQVIKIWFQNERSRQRKRAKHIMEEANASNKSYKCRECGMRFGMLTFLVKHSMRHIGDKNENSPVKICPICQEKYDKDQLVGHLRQTHNINMSLLEEYRGGLKESLTCHLCKQKFPNQDGLMIHKHKHLTDDYGEPPSCAICKTTFVNAICLEAHHQTHDVEDWEFECNICNSVFHDKLLMASHRMGHGVQSAERSKSQSSLSEDETKSPQTEPGQVIKTLVTSVGKLGALSTSTPGIQVVKTLVSTSSNTPTTLSLPNSQVLSSGTTTNIQIPSKTSSGVNFVKLIPVQIVPVSSIGNSNVNSTGTKTIITTSGIKAPATITTSTTKTISTPTIIKSSGVYKAGVAPIISGVVGANTATSNTTYITLPVRGTNQIVKVAVKNTDGRSSNPLLNQLLDSSTVKTASIATKPGVTVKQLFPGAQISTLPQLGLNRPIIRVSKQGGAPRIISNLMSVKQTSEDQEVVDIKEEVTSDVEEDPLATENNG